MAPLVDLLRQALGRVLSGGTKVAERPVERPAESTRPHRAGSGVPAPSGHRAYPGDFQGVPAIAYAPQPDGQPDPGEIVWTWVPFEEDHTVGKDRPVLLVGTDGDWLLAVMLTSKDHDRDARQEHRSGREWVDIGSGGWDKSGRPSEVRVNRIIRVDPEAIRREGAVLAQGRFEDVAEAMRHGH
ncbi:MAG: type II toxin-antitoxin system PemK/MazF family toxin [Actinomycetota bacterium]|nr:type II toxin-antitoxin system PemK/MazF family toxin [Actinomycetota bacterium]